jgi:uncharacterized integral membrane protein
MILSVGFVLGAAAIVFALQNTQVVALTFLGWQFESSLALLVLVSLGIGVLISLLASLPSLLGASFKIMMLERQNRKLVQEAEERQQEQQTVTHSTVVIDDAPQVVDLRR